MEFELVDEPQAPPLERRPLPVDPRLAQRPWLVAPRYAPDWRDRAVLIPDQEYGS